LHQVTFIFLVLWSNACKLARVAHSKNDKRMSTRFWALSGPLNWRGHPSLDQGFAESYRCSILSWNLRLALGSSNLRLVEMQHLLNVIPSHVTTFCNLCCQVAKTRETRSLGISEILIATSANNSSVMAYCLSINQFVFEIIQEEEVARDRSGL
jgi:hypothetical protein